MKLRRRGLPGTASYAVTQRERENRALARQAAAEGFVLLKNEAGLLPLKKGSRIGLYGSGAEKTVKGGTGSGDVNERDSVSICQGLTQAGYEITSGEWLRAYARSYAQCRQQWKNAIEEKMAREQLPFFEAYFLTPFLVPAGPDIPAAAKDDGADTAIFVLSRISGEGADRTDAPGDYEISQQEAAQLAQLCRYYENVVLVINAGGLVDLSVTETLPKIRAIVQYVQAGQEGGNALADVLSGDITPSGKLADTWALRYADYPSAKLFGCASGDLSRTLYKEGIFVGYRYFDTFEIPVRYCFGHGLSYTTFSIGLEQICLQGQKTAQAALTVQAAVTNTGARYGGKEVAQVYVSCPQGGLPKEYRRLAGFEKTRLLRPGESQLLQIDIELRRLAAYHPARAAWVLEAGTYGVWLGGSLDAAQLCASLVVTEEIVLQQCQTICPLTCDLQEISPDASRAAAREAQWLAQIVREGLPQVELCPADVVCAPRADGEEAFTGRAGELVQTLSTQQLISLAVGALDGEDGSMLGSAGHAVPGAAAQTSTAACCAPWNVAQIVLADGPAGLRLRQCYHVKDGAIVKEDGGELERSVFQQAQQPDGTPMYQFCTAIPVGALLAQTWNPALLRQLGRMIGGEMELFGVTLWLAPGMNIHRNPLGGRNFEYYSEDPLLTGLMAAAMTDGVQSVPGCGTTIKHFACNNQEENRLGSDSIVSERALREIYLRGFEIAVTNAQPKAMMTSYNMINGVHAANSADLCTVVARREWGFAGTIMTDWMTTISSTAGTCDAAGCIRAGNDLIMPGAAADCESIRAALCRGDVQLEQLQRCVYHTLRVILQSNQYEA